MLPKQKKLHLWHRAQLASYGKRNNREESCKNKITFTN